LRIELGHAARSRHDRSSNPESYVTALAALLMELPA
jgi:hypothetical protein